MEQDTRLTQKSNNLPLHSDKWAEKKIRVTAPFMIATNRIKYLRVTNQKMKRSSILPCSWVGRINIVNMAILPKAVYRFNAMLIKIPAKFFTDLKRKVNFIWKKNSIAKTILSNKGTSGGSIISDFKLFYRAIVLKTA